MSLEIIYGAHFLETWYKYLLTRTIHSIILKYSTTKLETYAPIKLCVLKV